MVYPLSEGPLGIGFRDGRSRIAVAADHLAKIIEHAVLQELKLTRKELKVGCWIPLICR